MATKRTSAARRTVPPTRKGPTMKIAVIGAGGVGGWFGAKLALAGQQVQFLARGAHLAAMRAGGLHIDNPESGRFTLPAPDATDDPAQLRTPDIVLVATKLWDLADTGKRIAPVVGAHTVVVPFQNGVDAVDLLAQSIPAARVAAGVAYISAVIAEPGTIRQTGSMARLRVGALHPSQESTLRAFVEAGNAAGFTTEFVDDAQRMLWEKFVALNAMSAMTAMTRQDVGTIRTDADLKRVFEGLIREGGALARRSGAALPPQFEDATIAMAEGLPATMRASMAHDLLAGRRLEAPWLCGAVVRRAAPLGLDVPYNAAAWAALKPFVNGSAG